MIFRTVQFALVCAGCFFIQLAFPVLAAETGEKIPSASGVSASYPGDFAVHTSKDNSARQLAIALPVVPLAATKVPTLGLPSKVVHKKDQTIKITVPASVEDAIDVCSVTAQRLSKVGALKAQEVLRWGMVLFKQMNSTPTVTPLGGPYASNDRTGIKLWYMPDGRLKTIVQR